MGGGALQRQLHVSQKGLFVRLLTVYFTCVNSLFCPAPPAQTTAEGKVPAVVVDLEPALFFTTVVLKMTEDDVDLRFKAQYIKDIRAALPGKACGLPCTGNV